MIHAQAHANAIKESPQRKAFRVFNVIFLAIVCTIVVIPIWNVLITSLAEDKDVMGGVYLIIPRSFTFKCYARVLNSGYMRGFWNSMFIAVVGTLVAMVITVPMGFALAQRRLIARNVFMKMISLTLVFDAGIMPLYVLVRTLGLIDNSWSLILPFAVSTFNLIIVKNFMMSIPESFVESAWLDGCNDLVIFFRIVLPLSGPILAVMVLFYGVAQWNSWFPALLYISDRGLYPLQMVLREVLIQSDISNMAGSSGDVEIIGDGLKYATMVVATLPIMCLYPFLQKYFVKGVMIGAVKG